MSALIAGASFPKNSTVGCRLTAFIPRSFGWWALPGRRRGSPRSDEGLLRYSLPKNRRTGPRSSSIPSPVELRRGSAGRRLGRAAEFDNGTLRGDQEGSLYHRVNSHAARGVSFNT